jgi:hypothetical protein
MIILFILGVKLILIDIIIITFDYIFNPNYKKIQNNNIGV